MDNLLTPREVAARCRLKNERTVRRWCRAGKLPGAVRIGRGRGRWRIPESAVENMLGRKAMAEEAKPYDGDIESRPPARWQRLQRNGKPRTGRKMSFMSKHGEVCLKDAAELGPWHEVAWDEIEVGMVIRLHPDDPNVGRCCCCGGELHEGSGIYLVEELTSPGDCVAVELDLEG